MTQSVKVDDLDLDYTGNWQASGSCPGCSAVPNLEQMQFINDGTWHDAARQSDGVPVTMSYTFQGIGVMVYGITVNGTSERPIIKNVNLTFTLDDVQQGGYEYTPDATVTDYQFNVPFFTKLGLNSGSHALTMTLQPKSFVLLDYLVYYTSDETAATATDPSTIPVCSTQSSSGTFASPGDNNADRPPIKREGGLSTQTAVALAVLIPIVAGLAIVAIFFWFLRRRAARRQAHTQLPGAPPSVFYGGGSSRAQPTNAYSLAGAQPTAIQFGPFTPSDLLGASTYATTRNPFEPGSHVPSSVTGESPSTPNAGWSPGAASRPVTVPREKLSSPPLDPAEQRNTVPPLYSP